MPILARQLSTSLPIRFPFNLVSTAELRRYGCSGGQSFNNTSAVLFIYFFKKRKPALYRSIEEKYTRTKKLYHNFTGWIKILNDLKRLFNHLLLLALHDVSFHR